MDNDADIDGSDVKTYFAYDERWRVVGTYASPTAAGPTERWVHHAAGLAGTGGSSSIDSVVLRDRDVVLSGTGSSYGGDALEERVYVLQNWRADVVATLGRTGTLIEWIQYTPYGMAVTNPPGNADFNGDGGVDGADTEAFFLAWEGGLPSADINNDGAVDIADIAAFDDIWEAGETHQAGLCMLTAIRVGYAGYQWDGSVNNDRTVSGAMAGLYHVRHRVYDPELGRWTRRDPLGYVDGLNPNEYVGGRVVVGVDPTGKVSFLCLGCIACLVASGGTCGGMCCCGQYWDTPGEGFFSCFDKCIVNVPAGYNYACGSVCTGCRAFPVRTPKAYPPSNPGLRPPLWDKIPRASVELH